MKSIFLTLLSGAIMTLGILRLIVLVGEIREGGIKIFGKTAYRKENKAAYLKKLFTVLLVSGMFILIGFLFLVFQYLKQ